MHEQSKRGQMVPKAEHNDGELLKKCPWCDYSLRGLPIQHRCPECGQLFHRRAKLFRNMSPQIWKLLLGAGCFGFIWMKAYTLGGGGWNWVTTISSSAGIVTLLLAFSLGWVLIRQYRRSAVFVFVDPDTVFVCDPQTRTATQFPLVDIRQAGTDRLGRLVLHLPDRVVTTELMGGMFSQAVVCAEYVNWHAHLAIVNRSKGESKR